jgi:hypothetical protein
MCYTKIGPTWVGPHAVPVQPAAPAYPYTIPVSNPPAQNFTLDGNAFLNNWTSSAGVMVRRHVPFKKGQLVMVNWAIIEGTDSILYEAEVAPFVPTTNVIRISNRKQLHLFKGKEALIVLQDADDYASEVKVAWDDKIGFVNAFLLLPIEEEDVNRLGARRRATTKKTADRAFGNVQSDTSTVRRNRK